MNCRSNISSRARRRCPGIPDGSGRLFRVVTPRSAARLSESLFDLPAPTRGMPRSITTRSFFRYALACGSCLFAPIEDLRSVRLSSRYGTLALPSITEEPFRRLPWIVLHLTESSSFARKGVVASTQRVAVVAVADGEYRLGVDSVKDCVSLPSAWARELIAVVASSTSRLPCVYTAAGSATPWLDRVCGSPPPSQRESFPTLDHVH